MIIKFFFAPNSELFVLQYCTDNLQEKGADSAAEEETVVPPLLHRGQPQSGNQTNPVQTSKQM